jgi:hypothetical protein
MLQAASSAGSVMTGQISFMVIKLKETWYPYCGIDAATMAQLLSAGSAGRFYNQAIRSRPDGTHGPFDCRDHTMPEYP